mmetsp:Transcript_16320/g.24516  ORF Transcript_16320/g.24516 Transcript_16320/m.24516 type:complete len:554 (+) Transcript_16320:69-1730(+)
MERMNASSWEKSIPPKWIKKERDFLQRIRTELSEEFSRVPILYEDAYGDRKLLRFFRQTKNADKALVLIRKYLTWRKESQVDQVRQKLEDDYNRPTNNVCRNWPHGNFLLDRMSILPCSTELFDKKGNALCVEQYGLLPADQLRDITPEMYLEWQLFCLEYKSIQLERIAIEREKTKFAQKSNLTQGWGEIARLCTIFDMKGLTFSHMLIPAGFGLVKKLVPMVQHYYPWLQDTTHLVHTSTPVYSFWYLLKPLLPSHTQRKIFIYSNGATASLSENIHLDSLPTILGGRAHCSELIPPLTRNKNTDHSFTSLGTFSENNDDDFLEEDDDDDNQHHDKDINYSKLHHLAQAGETTQVSNANFVASSPTTASTSSVITNQENEFKPTDQHDDLSLPITLEQKIEPIEKSYSPTQRVYDHLTAGGHMKVYKRDLRRRPSTRFISFSHGILRISKQRNPLIAWRTSFALNIQQPDFYLAQGQAKDDAQSPSTHIFHDDTKLYHLVAISPPCCLILAQSPTSKFFVLEFASIEEASIVKSYLTTTPSSSNLSSIVNT